jgi:hypothetical protein
MRRFLSIVLLATPLAGHAQDLDSMQVAYKLGTVLGSEARCGFSYDQAGISAWIDANTDPSDMEFASNLAAMTQGADYTIEGMTESAKTAHCRAVERTARHYGFIK